MRFVEIKSEDQQALLSLHRTRDLAVRQRTQLINMLRGLLAEFGITIPKGIGRALGYAKDVTEGASPEIPEIARDVVRVLCRQLMALHNWIGWYEARLKIEARANPQVRLLQTIPGVGPITASAIAATVGSGHQFRNGREFAAWLGLTPLNRSSGGKERLGRISKMGDRYLRQLLVVGMTSRVPAGPQPFRPRRSVARAFARPQTGAARHGRHGEQDRQDHLGRADEKPPLRPTCRLRKTASEIARPTM